MSKILRVTMIISAMVGCTTINDRSEAPDITAQSSLKEILDTAVNFGGDKLIKAKKIVNESGRREQFGRLVAQYISSNNGNDPVKLISAAHLYQFSNRDFSPRVLRVYTRHDSPKIRALGWQLASLRPSQQMHDFIEQEVSSYIVAGRENQILVPELAQAISRNRVVSLFSVLRLGLMNNGADEFAKAMVELDPESSAVPFMDYIGQATAEDLLQINQKLVNLYSCLVILRYFISHPLPPGHSKLSHFFLYSVSRNPSLSDLARAVLEQQSSENNEVLVQALATLPVHLQVAFVEGTRRNPTINIKLLLKELKVQTRYPQVAEEIASIKIF